MKVQLISHLFILGVLNSKLRTPHFTYFLQKHLRHENAKTQQQYKNFINKYEDVGFDDVEMSIYGWYLTTSREHPEVAMLLRTFMSEDIPDTDKKGIEAYESFLKEALIPYDKFDEALITKRSLAFRQYL
jgi:hypothetical protein